MPEIVRVGLDDVPAKALLAALDAEYASRYGPSDELLTTQTHEFDPPDGVFVVVFAPDGRTIAGGGFRRFSEDACEVKRMWTSSAHRRQGLATFVLAELEAIARSVGYQRMVLESGPMQPEAHALYLSRGYTIIPTYGRYDLATAYERALEAT